jgi:hypothetical protein
MDTKPQQEGWENLYVNVGISEVAACFLEGITGIERPPTAACRERVTAGHSAPRTGSQAQANRLA